MIRLLGAVLAALLLSLLVPRATADAAPLPPTLQVEPARLEVTLKPGQKHTGKLAVTNTSSAAVTIRFYASDRRIRPGGKVEAVRGLLLPTSAASWVALSNYDEPLGPRERKEFDFKIAVPEENAAPGDYTAMLFAEVVPMGPVALATPDRTGALLVVSIPGQTTSRGNIVLLSSPPERVTLLPKLLPLIPAVEFSVPFSVRRAQPLKVTFSFVNDGTSRVRARGSLNVEVDGRTAFTIPAGVAQEVFPGDAADFQAVWPDPPDMGTFNVIARVDLGAQRPAEDGFAVRFFPWPLALGSLVPLGALVAAAVWLRRRQMAREFDSFHYMVEDGEPPATSARRPTARLTWSTQFSTAAKPARRAIGRPGSAGSGNGSSSSTPPDESATAREVPRKSPDPQSNSSTVPPGRGARSPEVDRLLGAGLAAVQLGAYADASHYFAAAVKEDDRCIEGWLLRAGTADSPEEAERCLRYALILDPDNAWAVEGLRLLAEAPRQG